MIQGYVPYLRGRWALSKCMNLGHGDLKERFPRPRVLNLAGLYKGSYQGVYKGFL